MREQAQTPYDLVVIVSDVTREDVEILAKVADYVILVPKLVIESTGSAQLTKAHLWRLLQYEQVAYVDSDHLLQVPRPDKVFDDCGGSDFCAVDDPWMPLKYLNGGFFVLKPNLDFYTEFVRRGIVYPKAQFDEQDMLNKIWFKAPGAGMYGDGTWKELNITYNAQHLTALEGKENGYVFVHAKYWRLVEGEGPLDPADYPWQKIVDVHKKEYKLEF